ncbi:MAG TPA: acyltransferase family protein, partial [Ramlibacter sp.]|nr:acyltransferase family protein [Ramlibacter sp.]
VTWNHLWYLPYLWFYTALLALLLPLLDSARGQRVRRALTGLRGARLLLLPALPLIVYSLVLRPHFPATHDLVHDAWLHAVYFTLFLYGYWIGTDEGFWAEATRLRWPALAWALVLLAVYLALLADPHVVYPTPLFRGLGDLYLWSALVAILGWAHLKLNRPWPWLQWANESVYPWYMLHQTVIIVLVVWLAPLQLDPWLEPALLVFGTLAGCWAITALVRRTPWLRPLFGLKPMPSRYPSRALAADPPARSA